MIGEIVEACQYCGKPIDQQQTGRGHRKKLYCDDLCRQRAHRSKGRGNVTIETNGDLQQRIAELERELAAAHHLIDEYINRKRTPAEWKKILQERFWQQGKAADWPTLSIHIPLEAGERAYRVFGLAASNELLEWASVALRQGGKRDKS